MIGERVGEAGDADTVVRSAAPAIPETWVPWPQWSVGVPAPQPLPRQVALEAATFGARSGFVASMPVSTIPTGAPAGGANVPGKIDQPASGRDRGQGPLSAYKVSSGLERSSRWTTRFGSA